MKKLSMLLMLMLISSTSAFALEGVASFYGLECCKYNKDPKCPMANGESLYEAIHQKKRYAAMWGIPFGTRVRVTNLDTGLSTVAEITDRGPNRRLGRIIDLGKLSFSEIAETNQGIINVSVEVL